MTAAPQGRVDFGSVDTTPGARCAMAPNAGDAMSADEYRTEMRRRWREDPGARQHMAVYALRLGDGARPVPMPFYGPHAATARDILTSIAGRKAA